MQPTNGVYVDASYNNLRGLNLANIPPIQPVVNITIGNLVSDEAMNGFSNMLQSFLDHILTLMTTTAMDFSGSRLKRSSLLTKIKKSCTSQKLSSKSKKTCSKTRQCKKSSNEINDKKQLHVKVETRGRKRKCIDDGLEPVKQIKKKTKSNSVISVKPQPTLPTNRKGGGEYNYRGRKSLVNVSTFYENDELNKENTITDEISNRDSQIINDMDRETNSADQTMDDYLDSHICWY